MSQEQWTEEQYTAASERADDLARLVSVEQARAVLEECLEHARAAGDEGFVFFFEGELANREGDYSRQLKLQQCADQLRPRCHLILRNIGAALAYLGRHQEALEWLDKALAVEPDDYRSLSGRGYQLVPLGRHQEALESLDKALAVQPDDYRSLCGRGHVLARLGRHEEALKWFDKALATQPRDFVSLRERGIALANLQRHKEALGCLDKALEFRPDDVDTLRARSITLGLMGKEVEAVQGLRQCLAIDSTDQVAKFWLGRFEKPDRARVIGEQLFREWQRQEQERQATDREVRDRKIKLDAWRALSARSAHRIGNQLFASQGALRTLADLKSPEAAEAVSDLQQSLDRVRQIVQEFQRFSVNEEPRLRLTDIGPLLIDIVRRYQRLAGKVELSATVGPQLPSSLVDATQMDQAVGELLENAMHFTPARGIIRVIAEAASQEPQRLRITVEDTGPGVVTEDKLRIFEAFVSTRPGGSGLGLAIVRQIVENHKGTIRETGKPGQGARFEIELPVAGQVEKAK